MNVVYLLGQYPAYSESFIANEIKGVEDTGIKIIILSIKKKTSVFLPDDNQQQIIYDLHFLSAKKVFAHLYLIGYAGRKYFAALSKIVISCNFSLPKLLKGLRNFSTAAFFIFKLRDLKADHIHAHFLTLPSTIALIMSEISGMTFSCSAHAHDLYTAKNREIVEKIKRSKFTVTCTKYNQDFLLKVSPDIYHDRIYHNYHGIPLTMWPSKTRSTDEFEQKKNINILLIGRFVEKKGIIYLLEAMVYLKKYQDKFSCTIVGDGPLESSFREYIQVHGLEASVNIVPPMSYVELRARYILADVFVLPCIVASNGDRDGLPNVLLEALAVGVPVIATSVTAINELIEHDKTGISIPERDANAIAQELLRLSKNQSLYGQLVSNGRKKVEEFEISKSIARLCELFKRI